MLKQTPLHDVHVARGAAFTDFGGWTMPVRYTSEIAEHIAVRTAAGLFDLSHMGEIEVAGAQAGAALDYALVGQPSRISVGRARYSMMTDESGGILDDLVVYRIADERYLVVANAGNVDVVVEALTERVARFDARLVDASNYWSLIAVQGPMSAAIVSALTALDLSALKYYAIAEGTLAGQRVLLARTGYTGEDGFEVYCTADDAADVWSAFERAGGPHGLVPAGLACRDTLRLEAGMPLFGRELDLSLTPFDAGLGRVVVFGKAGGFIGEEALEKQRDGERPRRLVGLVARGRRSPRHGYPVVDPATGREVGVVTSGAPSPTLGCPIAMAYVGVELGAIGTELSVDIRGTLEHVKVASLPFYRRPH